MKFLPSTMDNKQIIPLNLYYTEGEKGRKDDYIDIIFKDLDTGKKYVETIIHPLIEIYIVRPECRNFHYIKNCILKSECYPVIVPYKFRYREIAKILGCSFEDAMRSPYVANVDIDIRHFYLAQFIKEYPASKMIDITCGFLDIENDVINIEGIPDAPGIVPINCVTYCDGSDNTVYTLVLRHDNVESDSLAEYRDSFREQMRKLENDIPSFISFLEEVFNVDGNEFTFKVMIVDNEQTLLKMLFNIIRACDNDYVYAWNAPYDMTNIIERAYEIGLDASEIMIDPKFFEVNNRPNSDFNVQRCVSYIEDRNPNAHKRRHVSTTYSLQTYVDQLVVYAGIRAGRGKIPSLKLGSVAMTVLKDTKLDYSEEGNFRFFPYVNLKKFIRYNIKDVLLQVGIENKTKDIYTFYLDIIDSGVLPGENFVSTLIVGNSFRMFVDHKMEPEFVIGINRNKLNRNSPTIDYDKAIAGIGASNIYNESEEDYAYFDHDEDDDDEYDISEYAEEEPTDSKSKKRIKYDGALVSSTEHMQPTGFKILGRDSKYVHNNVIDMDVESEYPTAISIMNVSNDTLVGKVIFENPEDNKMPIYGDFMFTEEERKTYKDNPGIAAMELYSEDAILPLGSIFFKLPNISTILNDISSNIDNFI